MAGSEHLAKVDSGQLGAALNVCDAKCPFNHQCMQSKFTVLLLRKCAAVTYGDSLLLGEKPSIGNHAATRNWFNLVFACRVLDQDGKVADIAYHVQGARICSGAFGAAYCIPPSTLGKIARNVKRGDQAWVTYASTATSVAASSNFTLVSIAESWWMARIRCYDFMPHLRRVIIHPVRFQRVI